MSEVVLLDTLNKRMEEFSRQCPVFDVTSVDHAHWAATLGLSDKVRAFLDAGGDVNASVDGASLLHMACGWRHLPVISLLLERGANRLIVDHDGLTATIPSGM